MNRERRRRLLPPAVAAAFVAGVMRGLCHMGAAVKAAYPYRSSTTAIMVGIIPGIKKLKDDLPNVRLAVSLHAPIQDIRCQIMPAASAFPLQRLMDALHLYQEKCGQKIFIEYIMLDGINDQERHAHELGKLLKTLDVVINLIPFNAIGSSSHFMSSSEQNVKKFQKMLREVYKIRTTVRKQMGQDISGACGQLVIKISKPTSQLSASMELPDIEDLHA
ncbi:putative dual-specificity RNA methyltransferase [Nymphaea thermarum]|nr:putative dual-specificity RNA methyltransferase [Nymphaea thermarum]